MQILEVLIPNVNLMEKFRMRKTFCIYNVSRMARVGRDLS